MPALFLVVLLIAGRTPRTAFAFNADYRHAVLVPGPGGPGGPSPEEGGLFGYSVAFMTMPSAQLLVGEPKGAGAQPRPEVSRPGTLYLCPLDKKMTNPPRCTPAPLNLEGNVKETIGGHHVHHLRNESMFGSTVAVSAGGMAVVCSPGWKNQLYREKHYLMNGLCYSPDWNTARQQEAYVPLASKDDQGIKDPQRENQNSFFYAFGEAGFSAHVSEEAREVLLGAPGVYQWRGTVIRYRVDGAGRLGSVLVHHPKDPDRFEESGLFGYSVSGGRFFPGLGRRVQYVAGAPRAAHTGKVMLFDLPADAEGASGASGNMSVLQELAGEQLGEYFGAAVLAEDVTGDGLADLLVGAPLHTVHAHGHAAQGDKGRVYVYLNDGQGRLHRSTEPYLWPSSASGTLLGPRFGTAIAPAGDMNQDGYNDVWVGSPFEDEGRGAVYLFHGSAGGLLARPAQRVAALDLHRDLRSFGFSLAPARDVDGNGVPDVAVGAPLSGHAVVLPSRPAASVVPSMTSSARVLSLAAPSFVLTACLRYDVHLAGHHHPDARAIVTLTLLEAPAGTHFLEAASAGRAGPAGAAVGGPQRQQVVVVAERLEAGRPSCSNATVALRPGTAGTGTVDYTIPIDVEMRFNFSDEASQPDSPFCKTCPMLNPATPTWTSLRVAFDTGCRESVACKPDLTVSAEWQGLSLPFVIGSRREVALRVTVRNSGEPAYMARVAVTLSAPLSVAKLPAACQADDGVFPAFTSTPTDDGGGISASSATSSGLICALANPLNQGQTHELTLRLDVSAVALPVLVDAAFLAVTVNGTSAGRDEHPHDNVVRLRLPLHAKVVIGLAGRASPEQVLVPNDTALTPVVRFTHTYQFHSEGPTPTRDAQLRLLVPSKARSEEKGRDAPSLLDVMDVQVVVDGTPVHCAVRVLTTDKEAVVGHVRAGLQCGGQDAVVVCEELLCPLGSAPSATVDLRGEVWVGRLAAVMASTGNTGRTVAVKTTAEVVLPYRDRLPASTEVWSRRADLSTLFLWPSEPDAVEPWVVALSVAAGLLLLLLLIFALWKVGFFFRRRIPEDTESILPRKPGVEDDQVLLDDVAGRPRPAPCDADGILEKSPPCAP